MEQEMDQGPVSGIEQAPEQGIEVGNYFTAPDGTVWVSEEDYNLCASTQLEESQMGAVEPQEQEPDFGIHR